MQVIAILVALAFGQLTRINLSPQIAFYFHDCLILFFIVTALTFYRQKLCDIRTKIKRKTIWWGLLFLGWIALGWWPWSRQTLVAILYSLRLTTYIFFWWLVGRLRVFSAQAWSKVLLWFWSGCALLGVTQYLFWPDTRFLENLGWDDHYYRLIGTWFDPAFTALNFVFALIYINNSTMSRQLCSRRCRPYLTLLFGVCLALTFSRSSFLALGIVMTAVTWLRRPALRPKKWSQRLLLSGFTGLLLLIFAWLARKQPSDSTNLLRTNSIMIRAVMFHKQLGSLVGRDWLLGRGFYVPLSGASPLRLGSCAKETAAFPDNVFLLIISFFGFPIGIFIIAFLIRYWWQLRKKDETLWLIFLAVLINGQFNQAFLQPFIVLILGAIICAQTVQKTA